MRKPPAAPRQLSADRIILVGGIRPLHANPHGEEQCEALRLEPWPQARSLPPWFETPTSSAPHHEASRRVLRTLLSAWDRRSSRGRARSGSSSRSASGAGSSAAPS